MQILLADFDNDGDLDLFLLDGPKFSNSTQRLLYRNNRSGGFTDVSAGSGLSDVAASAYGHIIAAHLDTDGPHGRLVAGDPAPLQLTTHNATHTITAPTPPRFPHP